VDSSVHETISAHSGELWTGLTEWDAAFLVALPLQPSWHALHAGL
jgi:hypothetical protein